MMKNQNSIKIQKNKTIYISLFFINVFTFISINDVLAKINLESAISSARENNLEIKSEEKYYQSVKTQKKKALTGFLPRVSADINNGSQKNSVTGNPTINSDLDRRSINVSQDLWNGGNTVFQANKADSLVKKEKSNLDQKQQEIYLKTIKSYIDILRYTKIIEIQSENVDFQEKLVEYVEKRSRARDITKSELTKAKSDYIQALSDKITSKNNLELSKAEFKIHTGLEYQAVAPFEDINEDVLIRDPQNLEVDKLYALALQNNPKIKMAKNSFQASKYNYLSAVSSLSPTVKLNFDSSDDKHSIYLNNRRQRNSAVYINLHIPIFNSGIEYSDISIAKSLQQQEKYDFEAEKNNTYNSISKCVGKIKSFHIMYKSSTMLEEANKTYFESIEREEKLGTKSLIDLLIAKKEFYSSKVNKINYYYEKIYSGFELKAEIGELMQ